MLVASTNPTIVYYHDGFLRVSLNTYDKFSKARNTHLTNTHLSKKVFAEAANGTKINNMTEDELREYQMWTLKGLESYLILANKTSNSKWLEEELRPKFQKAYIHTVRMTSFAFWKKSNVFELYGLDFMLDDKLNLWFIECNSSPQLIGTNDYKTEFLIKMLNDMIEIELAYYRSRMKRVFNLLDHIVRNSPDPTTTNIYRPYQDAFKLAYKNKLEPEYQISPENSFVLIMDKNLEGAAAYKGHITPECV